MEHDDARAGAPQDASGLEAAFGRTPPHARWWADSRLRLGLLLAGLALAVLALLSVKTELFNRAGVAQRKQTEQRSPLDVPAGTRRK